MAHLLQRGFPSHVDSPAAARRWAVDVLAVGGEDADDVQLLVSELVTNAVMHAGLRADQDIVVRAGWVADHVVRVEVCDEGGRFERPSATPERADGGRGLQLVRAIAQTFGVHHDGVTLTWFTYAVGVA